MRIYLDHNATTPVRPEVAEAVADGLSQFGNPSSPHAEGAAARAALERARGQVAAALGAEPFEVIFTAGASEANNLALHGSLAPGEGLVTSTVEHPSVLEPAAALERAGCKCTRLDVDAEGQLEPANLEAALSAERRLVSLIWANNETGVLLPIAELGERVRERGVLMHSDATQVLGKLPIDFATRPVDLLSFSAHKLGGPKGIGCLLVRRGVELAPFVRGGPQERRLRGGTENVPGALGFGVACELAVRDLSAHALEWARLRDALWAGIQQIPGVRCNGGGASRLPNTLNVEFAGVAGDVLVEALDLEGVAVSSGSACASGSVEASHVLRAMGRSEAQARGAVRFSLGHGATQAEIERVIALLPDVVARVRGRVSS